MNSRFSDADLEPTKGTKGKSNRSRWEVTARFAIYQGLKKRGLIETRRKKNEWYITPKGREALVKVFQAANEAFRLKQEAERRV